MVFGWVGGLSSQMSINTLYVRLWNIWNNKDLYVKKVIFSRRSIISIPCSILLAANLIWLLLLNQTNTEANLPAFLILQSQTYIKQGVISS